MGSPPSGLEAGLSTLRRYKEIEKSFAKRIACAFSNVFSVIGRFLARLIHAGSQKLTIMFVPHTERRIFNLQISFFGLALVVLVLAGGIGALGFAAVDYSDAMGKLVGKSDTLQETQSQLDAMRDNTSRLVSAARSFQIALDATLAKIGAKPASNSDASRDGDLASFFELSDIGSGSLREAAEIEQVTNYLERSVNPIQELGDIIAAQGATLTEIPNLWPIKGGIGHISMYYGQNENPIYGSWYMHKGIDISTFRSGDPILATADGKVVTVAYDIGLGNYVILEHKYGFLTRYAHMKAAKVQKGQMVRQGQTIGYIGNTGLSTGPHLHYEIHLGTETIDPLQYIKNRSRASILTLSP